MPVRPTGEGNHIRMPLSAGGFFRNLFSLDLCMAYCEVAHPEKRPTPIFPAQSLSDGQNLLHDATTGRPAGTEAAETGL